MCCVEPERKIGRGMPVNGYVRKYAAGPVQAMIVGVTDDEIQAEAEKRKAARAEAQHWIDTIRAHGCPTGWSTLANDVCYRTAPVTLRDSVPVVRFDLVSAGPTVLGLKISVVEGHEIACDDTATATLDTLGGVSSFEHACPPLNAPAASLAKATTVLLLRDAH